MNTMKHIGHGQQHGIGMALLAAVAVTAVVMGTLYSVLPRVTAFLRPAPVAPAYIPQPRPYTGYEYIPFNPGAHHSLPPQGMADHPPVVAVVPSNVSPLPRGLTDYLSLLPTARVNHSAVPTGLTDYLSLLPTAHVNYSPLPHGYTDYLPATR